MSAPIVIAVDGTAASGKGTLAKRLARHFNFAHLDSGALYRLVALRMLQTGADPANEADAVAAARSIDPARADDPAIRTAEVGRAAATVASLLKIRVELLATQREFAAHPPSSKAGSVIDGRDIGTVVCPQADVKFFVDAAVEVRAHRRYLELKIAGYDVHEDAILRDLAERDAADKSRENSPLIVAPDAIFFDTTKLSVEEMCGQAILTAEYRLRSLSERH